MAVPEVCEGYTYAIQQAAADLMCIATDSGAGYNSGKMLSGRRGHGYVELMGSKAEEDIEDLLLLDIADRRPTSVEIGWQEGRMLIEEDIEDTLHSRR